MIPEYVNAWLEQWDQDNRPIKHHPYRVKDSLIVLGECTGVVVYPREDNERLTYEFLSEDDEHYFDLEEKQNIMDVTWMIEDISCLGVAWNYIVNNATPSFYVGTDIQCGWKMPWKN